MFYGLEIQDCSEMCLLNSHLRLFILLRYIIIPFLEGIWVCVFELSLTQEKIPPIVSRIESVFNKELLKRIMLNSNHAFNRIRTISRSSHENVFYSCAESRFLIPSIWFLICLYIHAHVIFTYFSWWGLSDEYRIQFCLTTKLKPTPVHFFYRFLGIHNYLLNLGLNKVTCKYSCKWRLIKFIEIVQKKGNENEKMIKNPMNLFLGVAVVW